MDDELKEIMEISARECGDAEKYYRYLKDGRINIFAIGMFTKEDTLVDCTITDEERNYVKEMMERLCCKNGYIVKMDNFLYSIGIKEISNRKKFYILDEIYNKYIYYLRSGVLFENKPLTFEQYINLLKEKIEYNGLEFFNMFTVRRMNVILNIIRLLECKDIQNMVKYRYKYI